MATAAFPHAYPFRFVDTVSQRADAAFEGGRARIRVTANSRAAMGEGWQSPLLLAEAIAQAALLLEAGDADTGRRGYLAGIQELTIERPPRAGETLEVSVRLSGSFGKVFRFDGDVRGEDGVLARGSVLVRKGGAAPEGEP
jgi:3-hydroxymyristoyl/3-hydroxydecanoyl-(acyl carrier protein) dehydratase